jgi:hypothetical protein
MFMFTISTVFEINGLIVWYRVQAPVTGEPYRDNLYYTGPNPQSLQPISTSNQLNRLAVLARVQAPTFSDVPYHASRPHRHRNIHVFSVLLANSVKSNNITYK